ncbi:MAG: hypothetical protein ACYC1E_11775 [Propionibacteriaceae bacterium]
MPDSVVTLRERSRALRAEALDLLEGPPGDVLREAFGEVDVTGRVSLDLMAWRDIDLFVPLEAVDAPAARRGPRVGAGRVRAAGEPDRLP